MSDWYRISDDGAQVQIEFVPSPNRFWPPEILRRIPLPVQGVNGRRVVLTGSGAVWMYAHAAATLRAAGARDISTLAPTSPGTSDELTGCDSRLVLDRDDQPTAALLHVHLRASPRLSPSAIHRLIEPRLEELSRLRLGELVLSGRTGVQVYARVASAAIDSGVQRITCWSARDGLIVVHDPCGGQLGRQITRPDWLARVMPKPDRPVIIGIAGDPNRGKSTFSTALDWYREQKGMEGWRLDCDGQSPTPPWYLSLVREEMAERLRRQHKRPWTPEMEAAVVDQLRLGRELFSVLIADLPGGNHKLVPAARIPAGRERMFAEVDALILLDRSDDPSEEAWRAALRQHQLEGCIAAVLITRDPQGPPSLSLHGGQGLWRGTITGLDRTRSANELGAAFRHVLDQLWPDIIQFAQRRAVSRVSATASDAETGP